MKLQDYSVASGENDILHDEHNIYIFVDGKWKQIILTDYYIEEKPIKINGSIFFVATDPKDESQFPERYIWEYRNGEVEIFSISSILDGSAVIADGNDLIFASGTRIFRKNTVSREQETLVKGGYICWKEEGKSFFYSAIGKGLALYDLDSNETFIINEKIYLTTSPIYDSKNNVLYFACDNPKNWSSNVKAVRGFYFLENDRFVTQNYYFNCIGFSDYEDFVSKSISEFYW